MDRINLAELKQISLGGSKAEPRLLLDYAPQIPEAEVPDPYFGTLADYRLAIKLIYAGSRGLLEKIAKSEVI